MERTRPVIPVSRAPARLTALLLVFSLFGGPWLSPELLAAAPRPGTCESPRALAPGARAQLAPAAGWLRLSVREGERYRLSPAGAAAPHLTLHAGCADEQPYPVPAAGLEFTANRSGALFLAAEPGADSAGPATVQLESLAPQTSRAVLARIPPAVQRRALEFLEETRGSDLAPEWREARLNAEASILYRPDVKGAAYYEFSVEKPGANGFEPAGFIELAAGEHDFPVTRWDVTGKAPTGQLAELAPQGVALTTFYKLDALAYAAEYEVIIPLGIGVAADNVVNLGDLPGRIVGLESLPQKAAELVTESVDSDGKTQRDGPTTLPAVQQEDWGTWAALKEQYTNSYAPQLAALKQSASEIWSREKSLLQDGESLIKGDVRVAYGLPSQTIASFTVTGEGAAAQYLRSEAVSDGTKTTGVRLTVLNGPSDRSTLLPFQVQLTYAGGGSEVIKYAIINSALVSANTVYLPLVEKAAADGIRQNAAPVAPAAPAAAPSGWGPWSYWWADGDAASIRYGQFDYKGCASGCGGTAWAMLFAWTDRRAAEGHPRWAGHWGLYRQNGAFGANAVAPLAQDTGVQNITKEIRDQIGTFCIFGSGATFPWNMIGASNYVRPRATAAWRMNTRYDPTGLCWFGACDGSRNLAREQIVTYRAPAVVGTGWLKHYPLAFGYAERSKRSCVLFVCWTDYSRWFYVNNGWYGRDNGWTSADVWFAGVYRP